MNKQIEQIYQQFLTSNGISTDTRTIEPGNCFVALKGGNFNGNQYAKQALEKGAKLLIVDEPVIENHPQVIQVEDALQTLQQLAYHHRMQFNIPVLAITGSNGKTTTKELLASVLQRKYKVHFTAGNLNNHIGVPLTLLRMPKNTDFAVIEMGANHQKEIEAYCQWAAPTCGLITNIGKAHLEGFGSIEGIIKGKSELYDYLADNDGFAFVLEDELLKKQSSQISKRVFYGGTYKAEQTSKGLIIRTPHQEYQTQLFGAYNATNVLAAVAVGQYFDVSENDIQDALAMYHPSNGRSQLIQKAEQTIILDAYNANPTSMKAAVQSLIASLADEKAAILGDMLEVGEASIEEHQQIVNLAESVPNLKLILVGPQFKACNFAPSTRHFNDVQEVAHALVLPSLQQHTVLIKGSRGMALDQLVEDE